MELSFPPPRELESCMSHADDLEKVKERERPSHDLDCDIKNWADGTRALQI